MKRLHILYIPGVGDSSARAQGLTIHTWRIWGVDAEVLALGWSEKEGWETKRSRLLTRIDELVAEGKAVGVVGASAGAAAAISAYGRRSAQLVGCVIVAGKINHADAITDKYRTGNPDLVAAVEDCDVMLQKLDESERRRMLSLYALYDDVIPRRYSKIVGAKNRTMPVVGHVFAIAGHLLFGGLATVLFLRRLMRAS